MARAMTSGRVIAEFSDYDGLLAAIRNRVSELQINGERFDQFAGLPIGYLSKLIGPSPVRRIGMTSLGPLFSALAISAVLIENGDHMMRLRNRLKPNNQSYRRTVYTLNTLTDRKWSRIQKLGRQARWKRLSKRQRSEIMRMVRHGRR
jgi:hypothetical protein